MGADKRRSRVRREAMSILITLPAMVLSHSEKDRCLWTILACSSSTPSLRHKRTTLQGRSTLPSRESTIMTMEEEEQVERRLRDTKG